MRVPSTSAALLIALGIARAVAQEERPPPISLEVGETTPPAESGPCDSPGDAPGAVRTNSVTVKGRWAGKIDLPLKPGDPLTEAKSSAALNALREAISKSSDRYFNSMGEVHVLKVEGECFLRDDGSADYVLTPRYVGLSAVRIGDNVLPIPRWREPKPYTDVPPFLRALLPALAAGYDDVSGTSLSAAVSPRLLHTPRSENSSAERDLTAQLAATHSLDESVYADEAKLAYTWRMAGGLLREATLSTHYSRERELLQDGTHDSDSRGAAVGIMLKLRANTRLHLDAGYDRRHEELTASATAARTAASEDETSLRVLLDAIPRPMLGFARASLWMSDADGYRRSVARVAYGKEFAVRRNQTVGAELTLGGGRAWGDVPDYARFYGGGAPHEFLYDGASSPSMLEMPQGPILRSFGENAARLPDAAREGRGGRSFWHVNLDIAVPIPRWSMPLIPNESTDISLDDSGEPLTLKQMMLNQVQSGPRILQPVLVQRGMSAAEAQREADEIFAEITPAARYVIDDANVFSIKPMLLLDAAGLSDGRDTETWIAAGVGVQVTVVTAKFEGGYSRTLHGPTFGSRGAPFARLVFQRLF